jgi:hypothetical protein
VPARTPLVGVTGFHSPANERQTTALRGLYQNGHQFWSAKEIDRGGWPTAMGLRVAFPATGVSKAAVTTRPRTKRHDMAYPLSATRGVLATATMLSAAASARPGRSP